LRRTAGGWGWLAGFIALFHFFVPFFILLFRKAKKDVQSLAAIALLIFFMQAVEIFWAITPTFYPQIIIHWTDVATWLGIGGIWFAIFLRNLCRHPLLARNDPRLETFNAETTHAK
jgi:hypothetical protein